jgi:hypothetical protein
MKPQRIVRPVTAFSVASKKQRTPRELNEQHLAFIRRLPCCICGVYGCDPAHIRSANALFGKRETGGAEKAADKWTVPLCRIHHDEQHATNELTWWASKSLDPFGLALALYDASGDEEIAEGIIASHRARRLA